MLETKLVWYTPAEKLPKQNEKREVDIIWVDVDRNIMTGYFMVWRNIEKWVYAVVYDDSDFDFTKEVKFWAYLRPLDVLIDNQ